MDIQTFTTLLNYKTFLPIGMMTTTTKNMVLLIAILMLADMINSQDSRCLVNLRVEIEFRERAVTSDFRYTKTTLSSSYFKEAFDR